MEDFSDQARQDRRSQNIPVDVDRRMPKYDSTDAHTRISILEVKIMNTDDKLAANQETTAKLVDRLDSHIQAATQRDTEMQQQLNKVSYSVLNLSDNISVTNDTLKEIAKMAGKSHDQLVKWDTIAMTVIKVATVLSVIIGAGWTVYTYVDSKQTNTNQGIHKDH